MNKTLLDLERIIFTAIEQEESKLLLILALLKVMQNHILMSLYLINI